EPIQGAGAVIIPPETYWPEIQRICDEHDILLIADEVICGFGRTGEWFGSQTLNIRPDVMTIAKGLSSGYQPIGGSVISDAVADVINSDEFAHGYTYSGHPVACAVALENLRLLDEEGIVDYVRTEAAPYLAQKWKEIGDHPLVGEARSIGLMAALELSPDKANRAAFKTDAGAVGLRCRERCFANGLVMRHVGDTMIISPPLIISKDEIDLLCARAVQALDETLAGLKSDGLMQ
ncbi:MAG: aminotransferase class III-fold pyridoxal phosphate-dependent enzyme, partial [Amylibacter sp.]|nr:aminotransferase class III-fold pyridoxal phosphate-dependent enzyme [Amylibacter sp.]